MADLPRLVVAPDAVARAGALLAAALDAAIEQRGAARLAVPGGSAAAALPVTRELLGDAWSKVILTWVDERSVPFDDPDSNRGAAYRAGQLSREQPAGRELPLWLDGEDGPGAVARVTGEWGDELGGRLDVVLLGMGQDGHIASIFPGRPSPDAIVAFVEDSPKPPAHRITLTRRALMTACDTVLLAMGPSKRAALRALMRGDHALPALGLPRLVVVTDQPLDGVI